MSKCYARVVGGIGNQLFQIATAYSYSKKYDKKLVIDESSWFCGQGKPPTDYKNSILKNFLFESSSNRNVVDIHEKVELTYEDLPVYNEDVRLCGYFQSPKYFDWCFEEFKNNLWLPTIDTSFLNEKNVAFHIRRGDYLYYPGIFNVCGTDYFDKMFSEFKDYQINVFTDSPQHVLEEFQHQDFMLVQSSSELADFLLMSQHQNIVCSNSSFSWWASQLGEKKERIMVPNKWLLTSNSTEIYMDNMTLVNP